jgi:hypothetical protein
MEFEVLFWDNLVYKLKIVVSDEYFLNWLGRNNSWIKGITLLAHGSLPLPLLFPHSFQLMIDFSVAVLFSVYRVVIEGIIKWGNKKGSKLAVDLRSPSHGTKKEEKLILSRIHYVPALPLRCILNHSYILCYILCLDFCSVLTGKNIRIIFYYIVYYHFYFSHL